MTLRSILLKKAELQGVALAPWRREGKNTFWAVCPGSAKGAKMKRRYMALPIVAAVGLAVGVVPAASAAIQPNITCGETITTSITLNKNLTCAGTAFSISIVGQSRPIVVDLGAHSVTTTGSAVSVIEPGGGTIQNGRIAGRTIVDRGPTPTTYQNLTFDGIGMSVDQVFGDVVKNSRFINGARIDVIFSADQLIENNVFVNGPANSTAIAIDASYATVLGNTITGYGTGIASFDDFGSLDAEGNVISHVHGDGIALGGTDGDALFGVVANNVSNNNDGDGIVLGDGAGINHPDQQSGVLVTGNTTNNNGYDGIHLDPQGTIGLITKITRNHANSNGHLGIDAPTSSVGPPPIIITDGGGDTAKGNGVKAQCLNIVCTKS